MNILTWSIIIILLCLIRFIEFAKEYANPFKLTMIFGKKGSGKTTLLTKLAIQHLKAGYNVYTTIEIPGCIWFDVNDIGDYTFPEHSAVFIDEVGIIWDNRNFKSFRNEVRNYFKFQRQYRNKVYLFSQTFDVDLKLRNLTDSMYLCECRMNIISYARRIKRSITIVNPIGDAESRIADSLEFVHPIWQLFGAQAFIFTWIPHWAKYFTSFDPPKLPYIKGAEIPWKTLPSKPKVLYVQFLHRLKEDMRGIYILSYRIFTSFTK